MPEHSEKGSFHCVSEKKLRSFVTTYLAGRTPGKERTSHVNVVKLFAVLYQQNPCPVWKKRLLPVNVQESADGAVAMMFGADGVEVLGSESVETHLRTVLPPCYLELMGWRC